MSLIQEIAADIYRMIVDFEELKFQIYGLTSQPKPYGWHDSRFPPEYRRACLRGEIYDPDICTGIYVVMAGWYEKISGRKAPPNFEVYRDWKKYIQISGSFESEVIIRAIEIGTRRKRERRDVIKVLKVLEGHDTVE